MRKVIVYILMLACGLSWAAPKKPAGKKALPISTVQERKQWLNTCNKFLEVKLGNISDENDLFVYEKIDKNDPIILQTPEIEKSKPMESKIFTNEFVILQKVGEAIKPEGHIIVNGEYGLCLHGSRIITSKTSIKAKINDQIFYITIKNITKNQFTLQLNQHVLVFNY